MLLISSIAFFFAIASLFLVLIGYIKPNLIKFSKTGAYPSRHLIAVIGLATFFTFFSIHQYAFEKADHEIYARNAKLLSKVVVIPN